MVVIRMYGRNFRSKARPAIAGCAFMEYYFSGTVLPLSQGAAAAGLPVTGGMVT